VAIRSPAGTRQRPSTNSAVPPPVASRDGSGVTASISSSAPIGVIGRGSHRVAAARFPARRPPYPDPIEAGDEQESKADAGGGANGDAGGIDSDAALARSRGAGLIAALEGHMPTATARSEIAAALALAVATEAGAPEPELVAEAARLQEVGKLYTPASLLYAPESDLDGTTRAALESYYEHGHALARGAGVADRACAWILNARERWDGSGPTGLAGEDIPLGSRVIAVSREYLDAPHAAPAAGAGDSRPADPRAAALERLERLAGSVLDPRLAAIATELAAVDESLSVRERSDDDVDAVRAYLREQNAIRIARNGELVDPLEQPMLLAFSAEQPGEIAGLLTWIDGEEVEILTLHAVAQQQGVGTALIEALAERCAERGRERLIVTTTNDNLGALRFYQRRGFRLRALRAGAVDESRSQLKPSIPAEGDDGIPKRDEIELEREL